MFRPIRTSRRPTPRAAAAALLLFTTLAAPGYARSRPAASAGGPATATAPAPAATAPAPTTTPAAAEVVDVRKVWDAGRHNAFTDLLRWRDAWWCTFREADAHVGGADGRVRVLRSADGAAWESAALVAEAGVDLRDPKLSVTPDGRLMIVAGGSVYEGTKALKGRQPRVLFSADGREWTAPRKVLGPGDWLWRVTWHEGAAYGVAYNTGPDPARPPPDRTLTLYRSPDGVDWRPVTVLAVPGQPNETTVRFLPDGRAVATARREGGDTKGWVGVAAPPFTDWAWRPATHRFGGPNFIALPDGSLVAGTRDYTRPKKVSTLIARLTLDGILTPLATLPSGGDNSYPGLVWHDGLLWVSYYSSHEGKASIYLARLKLPPAPPPAAGEAK